MIFINRTFFLKEGITLVITIMGVFLGFLLSSYWHNRNKRKEKLKLDLKYIKLVNKELIANTELLNNCLELLNKDLKKIDLYEKKHKDTNFNQDFSKETINKCQNLITLLYKKFNNFKNEGVKSAYKAGINKILKLNSLFKLLNSIEEYKFDLNHKYRILNNPGIQFTKPNIAYIKFIKTSQIILETMLIKNLIIVNKLEKVRNDTEEELNLIKINYKIKIKCKNCKNYIYKSINSNVKKIKDFLHKSFKGKNNN